MKNASRASQRTFQSKKQNYHRNMCPSVIFKQSEILPPNPKPILNHPNHTSAAHVVQTSIDFLMTTAELAIEQIEKQQFCLLLLTQIENVQRSIENLCLPQVDQTQNTNYEDQQPDTSLPDSICGNERLIQKQNKRKHLSATAPTSPNKTTSLPFRIKLVQSNLTNKTTTNRHPQGVVPLTFVESEKDLRLTQLETIYHDKCLLEENTPKLPDELPQLMLTATRFNTLHTRLSDQFAFDYNGNRIPIASSSLKRNSINLLKTVCRVHKDKTETRNVMKIQEGSWKTQAENWSGSYRHFKDYADIKILKKGIKEGVNWQGKLASLKMISEIDQHKGESR